jgi:hypothetical protein
MAIKRIGGSRGWMVAIALLVPCEAAAAQRDVVVVFNTGTPSIRFAAEDVQAALRLKAFTGFHTVQNIIDPKYGPMKADEDGESPRLMSVKAYVDGEAPGGRLTPLEVADALIRHADTGLQRVEHLAPGATPGSNKELRQTLGDIKAMAWLGRYYAEKIRGAVALYRYQKRGDRRDHENARAHLQTASSHWRQYAALWSAQYVGQVLTRMGLTPVDIRAIQTFVDEDIPAPLGAR